MKVVFTFVVADADEAHALSNDIAQVATDGGYELHGTEEFPEILNPEEPRPTEPSS